MNVNTAANVVLIAAAVVWILWKQIQAAPIKSRLLVLAPLVMGYFGIRNTPGSTWSSAGDLTLILVGAVFSIGLGLARGGTIHVWREQDGRLWRQGSKMTLLLWGALLLVRVVMAGVAAGTGHRAATGLGPILFSLALSFAAQNAVTGMRMSALAGTAPAPAAGRTTAWADEDAPFPGIPTSPTYAPAPAPSTSTYSAPSTYSTYSTQPEMSATPYTNRHELRRADRRARRAARRESRHNRYQ